MRILILGGTSFVGRAIVEELLRRDHDVTLFGRGKTGPELFPGVERRTGDRSTGDYSALAGRQWDAVVDVSAYVPRHVGEAMDAVADRVGRYLFISTGSVYDYKQAPAYLDEECPRLEPRRDTEEWEGSAYGPLKVACEDDVLARLGDRATIVRPGIVAGPYDPTDRFTYWVRAAAGGGRVEVPGRLVQPIQVVDADDLAVLVVSLLEKDLPGIYNAVGRSMPFGELLRACSPLELEPVEVSEGRAPMLLGDPAYDVMFRRSAARAHAAGMPQTPVADTAAKVRAWDVARGEPPLTF
ncbi:MAG TPA: NAD-dependent epimerase/dehydratase family protein [Candidatus Limnocylindrales bacterium]|nr:NAD-dependent epimerase/dehydratase family protein [Candidatus Limnocylindrales bacterium]